LRQNNIRISIIFSPKTYIRTKSNTATDDRLICFADLIKDVWIKGTGKWTCGMQRLMPCFAAV